MTLAALPTSSMCALRCGLIGALKYHKLPAFWLHTRNSNSELNFMHFGLKGERVDVGAGTMQVNRTAAVQVYDFFFFFRVLRPLFPCYPHAIYLFILFRTLQHTVQ